MLEFNREMKRQKTQVRGRASIFIPKQAKLSKKTKNIDFSNDKLQGQSDDEDPLQYSSSGIQKYNLQAYNRDRKRRLNEFNFKTNPVDEEEVSDFDK